MPSPRDRGRSPTPPRRQRGPSPQYEVPAYSAFVPREERFQSKRVWAARPPSGAISGPGMPPTDIRLDPANPAFDPNVQAHRRNVGSGSPRGQEAAGGTPDLQNPQARPTGSREPTASAAGVGSAGAAADTTTSTAPMGAGCRYWQPASAARLAADRVANMATIPTGMTPNQAADFLSGSTGSASSVPAHPGTDDRQIGRRRPPSPPGPSTETFQRAQQRYDATAHLPRQDPTTVPQWARRVRGKGRGTEKGKGKDPGPGANPWAGWAPSLRGGGGQQGKGGHGGGKQGKSGKGK